MIWRFTIHKSTHFPVYAVLEVLYVVLEVLDVVLEVYIVLEVLDVVLEVYHTQHTFKICRV